MAVIRLNGAGAARTLERFFQPAHPVPLRDIAPDRLVYGRFVNPRRDNEPIDDGIVAVRPDGAGGHVIDLTVHGGLRVVERLLDLLQRCGAEIRSGGDRWDAAFAPAKTRRAVRFIARQQDLLHAELDAVARLCEQDDAAGRARLHALIARSRPAVHLVEGADVVFAGPPNAGKSTLINRLFDPARSLVSPHAGTTRDWVAVDVALDQVPLRVTDTAGVRRTDHPIEREAIDRGLKMFRSADVQVVVVDGSTDVQESFLSKIAPLVRADRAVIALNKADLPATRDPGVAGRLNLPCVRVSGLTGLGLEDLITRLAKILTIERLDPARAALFRRRWVEDFADLLSDRTAGSLPEAIRHRVRRIF